MDDRSLRSLGRWANNLSFPRLSSFVPQFLPFALRLSSLVPSPEPRHSRLWLRGLRSFTARQFHADLDARSRVEQDHVVFARLFHLVAREQLVPASYDKGLAVLRQKQHIVLACQVPQKTEP